MIRVSADGEPIKAAAVWLLYPIKPTTNSYINILRTSES